MALQSTYHPNFSVVKAKKPVAKNPLLRTVDSLIQQEKMKEKAFRQLQQAEEVVVAQDVSLGKLNYKHRFVAQGAGYALREKRMPTLQEHLHAVLPNLSIQHQRLERQWVLAVCNGVLQCQPPERLALVLLEQSLRLHKQSLPKAKKALITFSYWLKSQTVAYKNTDEGQRLAVIIDLLQFKPVRS
jgi:hypothetical protein